MAAAAFNGGAACWRGSLQRRSGPSGCCSLQSCRTGGARASLTPATTRPAGESVYTRGDWAAATRERCALAEATYRLNKEQVVLLQRVRRLSILVLFLSASSGVCPLHLSHPIHIHCEPPAIPHCAASSAHSPLLLPPLLHTRGATPRDMRVLPKRIFLVRHAESEGNVDNSECPVVTQRDHMQPPLCRHVSAQGRCLAGWLLADRARGCFAQHGAGFSPMPISSLLSSFCLCHWPQ